jgi:hypothetical protein
LLQLAHLWLINKDIDGKYSFWVKGKPRWQNPASGTLASLANHYADIAEGLEDDEK